MKRVRFSVFICKLFVDFCGECVYLLVVGEKVKDLMCWGFFCYKENILKYYCNNLIYVWNFKILVLNCLYDCM